MSEIIVNAESISKSFKMFQKRNSLRKSLVSLLSGKSLREDVWVIRDLSFQIEKGNKVAIIGKNGAGKTTLLRIMTGIYTATSGLIEINVPPLSLFNFSVGLLGELPIEENVKFLAALNDISPFGQRQVDDILGMAGLSRFRYALAKDMSQGQRQRLILSVFFQANADFVLFDEGLYFLDQEFSLLCDKHFQKLKDSDKTVVFAGHDVSYLQRYCDVALWLRQEPPHLMGDFDTVAKEFEEDKAG